MLKRPTKTERVCPECGQPLEDVGRTLRCRQHGTFFAYGPSLVVRTPAANLPEALAPWERVQAKR